MNAEEKNPPNQKFGKKVMSQQCSPMGKKPVMKEILNLDANVVNDENRPPSSIQRYMAKQLHSDGL
mgnify:CR=1 FL=1